MGQLTIHSYFSNSYVTNYQRVTLGNHPEMVRFHNGVNPLMVTPKWLIMAYHHMETMMHHAARKKNIYMNHIRE